MPGPEQDPQKKTPELPDEIYGEQEGLSRSGSPSWGGVDLSAGDNADATGGPAPDDGGNAAS
jgi:hypothetical protein